MSTPEQPKVNPESDASAKEQPATKEAPVNEQERREKQAALKGAESNDTQERQDFEKAAEQLIDGREIVSNATAELTGDALEVHGFSIEQMQEGEQNSLGKMFFDWQKIGGEAWKKFKGDMEARAGATPRESTAPADSDKSKEAVEKRVDEIKTKAAGAIANTVNRLIDTMNGIPPAKTQTEEAWEEVRHNAQKKFEAQMPPDQMASVKKWFGGMSEKIAMVKASGRTLGSMEAWDKDRSETLGSLESQLKEKGIDIHSWVDEMRAENLLKDVKSFDIDQGGHLGVKLMQGETEIADQDALLKAASANELTMTVTAKDAANAKQLMDGMNATKELPVLTQNNTTLTFERPLTLKEARRFFQMEYAVAHGSGEKKEEPKSKAA